MRVIGISAYYHDSAAALVDGGRIVEEGDHDALVRLGGRYAGFLDLQIA